MGYKVAKAGSMADCGVRTLDGNYMFQSNLNSLCVHVCYSACMLLPSWYTPRLINNFKTVIIYHRFLSPSLYCSLQSIQAITIIFFCVYIFIFILLYSNSLLFFAISLFVDQERCEICTSLISRLRSCFFFKKRGKQINFWSFAYWSKRHTHTSPCIYVN